MNHSNAGTCDVHAGQPLIVPSKTTKTVPVAVTGDTAVEANETFQVKLANPTGASIADGSGLGRITNDD